MIDYFKSMKDSFQGKFRTGSYRKGVYVPPEPDDNKQTESSFKSITVQLYLLTMMICLVFVIIFGSEEKQGLAFIVVLFGNLIAIIGHLRKIGEISHKRISHLEDELNQLKLKLAE